MTRFSIALRVLILAWLASTGQCSRNSDAPRNILLISIDTLRRDALGCYGAAKPVSPNLDRLAAESLVFDTAIAQAPWTLPSHAAMLTSLYPEELDLGSFGSVKRVSDDATSIAETLRDSGYATFAHVAGAFLDASTGLNQGFDHYDDRSLTMRLAVDRCVERLRKNDKNKPFFGFLHTYDVHKYDPPDEDRAQFVKMEPRKLASVPRSAIAELLQNNRNRDRVDELGPADRIHVRELYDASIHSVDREIGRLLETLRDLGLASNTVVIVTADHGEEFWEHGRSGHGYNLNDENLRVPLIVHVPNGPRGRFESQVRLIDLPPTIAAIAGIRRAVGWQGVDLLARSAGDAADLLAFSESAHLPFKSVRIPELKWIVSLRRPYSRWYDLMVDPNEAHASETSSNPDATRLERSFQEWLHMTARSREERGRATSVTDPALDKDISALGYSSGSESVPAGITPWLEALEGTGSKPRSK